MAQPIRPLLDELLSCTDTEFPDKLLANVKWDRPKGDLLHWIPILDRIDDTLASYIKDHDLENEFPKLRIIPEKDVYVICACLEFTKTLLRNCSDIQIYSSAERIYALINTPTIDVRLKALEIAVMLAEKFVVSGSSRFSAPKVVKNRVLELARSYPPLVPFDCEVRHLEEEEEKEEEEEEDEAKAKAKAKATATATATATEAEVKVEEEEDEETDEEKANKKDEEEEEEEKEEEEEEEEEEKKNQKEDEGEQEKDNKSTGKPSIIGDHYNFVDTLRRDKKLPQKWKSIHFQYYKSILAHQKDATALPKQVSESKSDNLVVSEGLQVFSIPEESVAKMTLEQIFAKGTEALPKSSWFSFGIAAEVAKSFNTQSNEAFQLREKLIRIKAYATGYTCCMLSNQHTSSRLLEAEPYVFSFLVDAISPENSKFVSKDVLVAALTALNCISMKKAWTGDIMRCMGGNVSHGVLFQCLRRIKRLVASQQDDFDEDAYALFFGLVSHMIKTKSLLPRLISGGLLEDLIPFLGLETKYKWTCSSAIHLLALYLSGAPDSLDAFIASNGFTMLIDSIKKEVNFNINSREFSGSNSDPDLEKKFPPYTKIPSKRASYLRNLLKLVADLLNSNHGDRLRNLFDSPLLESFNSIITHPLIFGPQILAYTIDSIFFIIHNEPTAFSILNEAKVIDTILDNYKSLFLPSGQLLISLAEVLGAISLNNSGLMKVTNKQSISTFFKSFYDDDIAKVLVESDMSTNLGCSFDELGRHYPSLKPIILDETLDLVKQMTEYAGNKLNGIEFYTSSAGSLYSSKDDTTPIKNDDDDDDDENNNNRKDFIKNWDNANSAFLVDNVYFFLSGLFQDSGQWGTDAIEQSNSDIWIKLLTVPRAPFDYFLSNGISSYLGVLKYFDEEEINYGLPKVISYLSTALEDELVVRYINFEGEVSFFQTISIDEASMLIEQLYKINLLLFTLTKIYLNLGLVVNDRIRQILENFGHHSNMLWQLSKLLSRSIFEETVLRMNTPDEVLKITSNFPSDSPPLQVYASDPAESLGTEKDAATLGTSAKFKNVLQLRTLNYYLQANISLLLATVVRACVPKRRDHENEQSRRDGVDILLSVAQGITDAFKQKVENLYILQSQLLGVSNVILYILNQRERGKDVVYTPFAIALFQLGFYDNLNEVAIKLWDDLLQMDPEEVQATTELKYIASCPSSIVKNALSQMFMIYTRSVNADDLSSIPFAKAYFQTGYKSNIEVELISSFLIQVRGKALTLLHDVILSPSCSIHQDNGRFSAKNIPSPLIEQLINIATNVFQGRKEIVGTEFTPFDQKLVRPPEDQLAYLISLGMTEHQADHYFDHHNDLSALDKGVPMSCPIFQDLKESDWKEFAKQLSADEVDFSVDFPPFEKSEDILATRKKIWSIEPWIEVAVLYPKTTSSIAVLFTSLKSKDVFSYLLNQAVNELPKTSKDRYAVYLHIISLLISSTTFSFNCSACDIDKLFGPSAITEDTVHEKYFPYLMSIFEQKFLLEDVQIPEDTKHPHLKFTEQLPSQNWNQVMANVFDQIKELKNVTDSRSANGLARVLVLYSKHYEYASNISEMPIMGALMKIVRNESIEKLVLDSLKTSMVMIIRGCFESQEVVSNYIKHDVAGIFSRNFKQSRSLKTLLKDNLSLVFRDANITTEAISNQVVIEGYSGLSPLGSDIIVSKSKIDSSNEGDVEMIDHGHAKSSKTGALMSLVMSELMDVVKTDWLSDPEDDSTKSKNKTKSKVGIYANKNFTYACFLTQTIAELLGSYKQAKFDFLTFSRKVQGEIKLRPTSLNFFVHQLIPTQPFEKNSDNEYGRRSALSSIAKVALMSLISTSLVDFNTTSTSTSTPNPKKEDPDLALIRRFVVDLIIKVMKDTLSLNNLAKTRYGKMVDLFDLTGTLISSKFRDSIGPLLDKDSIKHDLFYMTRVYVEKQMSNMLTSLISEFDLNFPEIEQVSKAALKPIIILGKNKVDYQELFALEGQEEADDDDIVPDEENEERDETPDLFRNSTLGMYDLEIASEEDDYDDEGALEVMIPGDDIESDESSELSAIDSGEDEDEEEEEEEDEDDDSEEGEDEDVDMEDEEGAVLDSERSLDDIEIIDELDLDSSGDNEEGYYDLDEEDGAEDEREEDDEGEEEEGDEGDGEEGVNHDSYWEEDGESEYDEDELDGWIEELEDENDEDEDEDEIVAESLSVPPFRSRVDASENDEDSEEDLSDSESRQEYEVRMVTPENGLRRLFNQAGLSHLDRSPTSAFSLLVDGLFREGNFRGSIEISGNEDARGGPNTIRRLFENMMHLGQGSKQVEHFHNIHIKSTKERWTEALVMFDPPQKDRMVDRIIPGIVNRIEDKSIEAYNIKQKEYEKIKKEREEKKKKAMEEEQKRQEEEAKQREENLSNVPPRDPIFVRIGDRDVDISGTDIDPDYIEALPEDMREEVLASYVRERRANASTQNSDAREIDPDFLNALPGNIRDEILQQESFARRYAALEESREDFADAVADEVTEEDDHQDNTLQSGQHQHQHPHTVNQKSQKRGKIFFTPLSDKQGIAAILRLLFMPLTIPQREQIYQALHYMCFNKQSRIEIINSMLSVLHDTFTTQRPIQKVFSQVYNRASDKESKLKVPLNSTPISIGIQFIESIDFLLERNSHLRYFLMTEHENPLIAKKIAKKPSRESKFQINYILKLLDNKLLVEDQTFLDNLARVLQVSTRPLLALKTRGENRSSPQFPPPYIPEENFRLIVKILTGNDCSNTTFRRTISAMQNFSVLENAQKLFSIELSEKAAYYGNKITGDLNKLTQELITDGNSSSKSFSNFSAHSSDQAKLLRILTALDYMYENKEKDQGGGSSGNGENGDNGDNGDNGAGDNEIEELTNLYKKLSLGSLWDALSDCLRELEKKSELTNVANALLPLIEALMVVCKHGKVKVLQAKDYSKYEAKKIDFTKEPIESLFFSFTDEHKKILNQMVRGNANLMSGPFGMLVKNPRVLEFDNKKNYFDRKLHADLKEQTKLSIDVRREQVFLDSYRALFFKGKEEFKNAKLEINFKGEMGIDAGGVTREWYQVLSRQMFNPDYALFTPVVLDETTFHPNRTSYINPEHLSFFKFIGRIIGKAIFDNCFLDCHFSRAVYKRILGQSQILKDMESLDLEYYKSLIWMLENDITDVITETFSVETDDYGEHKIIDLIENGRDVAVTEENKHDYVKKVVEYKLSTSVAEQMENFLIGFHEIIPRELVAIFDEKELELLISGLPDIDVQDWQANTVYSNYSPSSLQIQWFWRAVKSFDNEERARLLQFATGTSKVPLNGFKELSGASGTCKFNIHRDYGSTDRLPSSHTCFNQIDLPAYENYETLRGSLLMAISEGHEGFGLA
ncbi:TOM1 [Candida oxycetoniae]|uniref:HECT-type E3 ubiquitin transferase n=1 Tax=Candida oxycetoniae TaxID=497107 RepID=A0AAI9SXU0_9ASCO|nr:TOM1 [Candida oxycetoniae]KAI3404721.2 TOM1 [Candida oxycetoniae]